MPCQKPLHYLRIPISVALVKTKEKTQQSIGGIMAKEEQGHDDPFFKGEFELSPMALFLSLLCKGALSKSG